jgi:hypothetical protein
MMIQIDEMRKLIAHHDEFHDQIAYISYICNFYKSNIMNINDDMIEFDAMIEMIYDHDESIIIDAQFMIDHHEYSNRALMHFASNDHKLDRCICDEYCAYNKSCKICE